MFLLRRGAHCAAAARVASSTAQHGRTQRVSLHLLFGSTSTPHPDKSASGGEDAYFADHASACFGVADGVGGSARAGVDPGEFSRTMLRHAQQHLRGGGASAEPAPGSINSYAQELLAEAENAGHGPGSADGAVGGAVREDTDGAGPVSAIMGAVSASASALRSNPVGGSATLLLGKLAQNGHLALLNIGDSGALLLRPSPRRFHQMGMVLWPRIVLRSQDQTHFFNCPYQVSSHDLQDTADTSADLLVTHARAGDVIIAATDGVTDNLFNLSMQDIVAQHVRELHAKDPAEAAAAVQALAEAVATEAVRVGNLQDDTATHTPFSEEARTEGYEYPGGKLDDVAVVCAVVREGARTDSVSSACTLQSNF